MTLAATSELDVAAPETCCACARTGVVGASELNAGTPIDWVCEGCAGFVCIECALCKPGSVPRMLYDQTFCSEACRQTVIARGEYRQDD